MNKVGEDNFESRTERIGWIDTAKGIGILLVMLGHCYLDAKFVFWFYSFHMALFFFLSGYTFGAKGDYFSFLKKKARTLLIPYVFFVVVTMLCNGVLAVTHGNEYNVHEILKLYVFQKRYTLLWFIACMFLTEQLMYWLNKWRKIFENKSYFLIVGIIGLILFTIYRITIGLELIWNADLVLLALAFMSFGKWYKESDLWKYVSLNKQRATCVFIGFAYIVCSYLNFKFFDTVDWFSNAFGNPCLFIMGAIFGTLFVIEVAKKMPATLLNALGKNTLVFYGLHGIVIDIIYVIYNKIGIIIERGSAISFILACVSVVVSICILNPVNRFILKYCPWCLGKRK